MTNAPFAGHYSSYTPGCDYLKYDSMFLPRPEFPKYSGDPLEFKAFMNNLKRILSHGYPIRRHYFASLFNTALMQ